MSPQLKNYLIQHLIGWIASGGLTLVAVAAVRALPPPAPLGNRFYAWFYRFVQMVASNPDKLKL
jgi:hypothetical protein